MVGKCSAQQNFNNVYSYFLVNIVNILKSCNMFYVYVHKYVHFPKNSHLVQILYFLTYLSIMNNLMS